ncbi:MAG: RIP metalloprotease RseP [Pseudomonadota bacterium]
MTAVLTAVAAIVAIGVLVTVHEYGHYIVARMAGVKVLQFSVGFGKPIWSRRYGADQTRFQIAALPLGGYVKMLDAREGPVPQADRGRAYTDKSPWARIAILVAGPLANFLLTIAIFWLVFVIGSADVRSVVGPVTAGGIADRAGLVSGDEIKAVNGRPVVTWNDASVALLEAVIDGPVIELDIHDANARARSIKLDASQSSEDLTVPGALLPGLGFDTWRPAYPAILGSVAPDGAAASVGMLAGDRIIGVGDRVIENWDELVVEVSARPGETVRIDYLRNDVRPRSVDVTLSEGERNGQKVGLLGIGLAVPENAEDLWEPMMVTRRHGPVESVGLAMVETVDFSVLIVKTLYQIVVGNVSVKNISGPISIVQYAGLTAQAGVDAYLEFIALLSISLCVLNLLPIPMLDGGQIVFQLVEAVKGSPVSMRTEIIGQQVGITLLFLLMGFAVFQDIGRFVG